MAGTTRICWVIRNDRVWPARVIARYPKSDKTKLQLDGLPAEMVRNQFVDMFPTRREALVALQARISGTIDYYINARLRVAAELRDAGAE